MKLIRVFLLSAMLLAFGIGTLAQAQDFYCGDLSSADCSALQMASNNMASMMSGTLNADLMFSGEMDGAEQNFGIGLAGSWAGVGVGTGSAATLTGATSDPTALLNDLTANIEDFDGSLTLTITPPAGDMTLPGALTLELRLVDSIGYINFGSLSESLGGMGAAFGLPESGWGGTNLIDLFGQLTPMMGAMTGQMGDTAMATPMAQEDVQTIMMRFEQYVTLSGGSGTYNFAVDVSGLVNDPEFQSMMEAQGNTTTDAADLEGATLNATVTLTPDGQFIQDITLDLSAQADGAPFTMTGAISFSEHNTAAAVTAPEGAVVVTADELMQGAGAMMGGGMGN